MIFFNVSFFLIFAYLATPASSIYGGKVTDDLRPEVCSLWRKSSLDVIVAPRYLCPAVVASSRTLVTAAHCLEGANDVNIYYVICGVNKIDALTGNHSSIERFLIHEGYKKGFVQTSVNDIALIILKAPIEGYGDTVKAAQFSRDDFNFEIGDAYAWRERFSFGILLQTTLLETARFKKIDYATCSDLLAGVGAEGYLDDTLMFCAIPPPDEADNTGICPKDGGAPLIVNNVVIGLATWRVGLCYVTNTNPSVFTLVPAYYNFITENSL